MDYQQIRDEIARQGYKRTNETVKLEEFEALNQQVIYLYKEQTLSEGVLVVVHPELNEQLFMGIPNVAINSRNPLRRGSNMNRFPKHKSESPSGSIFYGRSLRVETLSGLKSLLSVIGKR